MDWYDKNRQRSFPFLAGTSQFPKGLVADAGFVMGPGSGYSAGTHTVRLLRVGRSGNVFTLEFASTAPGTVGTLLRFTRTLPFERYVTEFADAAEDGSSVSDSASESSSESLSASDRCSTPLWWGYLVTGDSEAFEALLPTDGEDTAQDGQMIVEPALVQNLDGTAVTSINIANSDRTRFVLPEDCGGEAAEPTVFIVQRCLLGLVELQAGYNCSVRQVGGRMLVSAVQGAGAGEPCEEAPVYPGEPAADGSIFRGGGPSCFEVIRSINGVGGPMFKIAAGPAVLISSVPETNTLEIELGLREPVPYSCPDSN